MKKLFKGCLFTFTFLILASITTFIMRSCFNNINKDKDIYFIIIGLQVLIITGIVFAVLHKKQLVTLPFKIICFIINAIALGCSMTGWYINRGFNNPLWLLILISAAATLYLIIMYLILHIPFIYNKNKTIVVIIMLVLSLIGYILLVIFTKTTYVSTYGYYSIIALAFFIAIITPMDKDDDLFTFMLIATYSVIVVIIIMIIIIAGGDGIDLDLGLGFSNKNKKK